MDLLLAHLSTKFAGQSEVVATEALTFILRHSKAARDALALLLSDDSGRQIPVAGVASGTAAEIESGRTSPPSVPGAR
jgi:hypothetical protein